jgi:hypothetical protein
MRPIRDIKVLLAVGYIIGYPLAVLAPILIDPLLKSHVNYPSRNYPYAELCLPIYITLLTAEAALFKWKTTTASLYVSVCIFALSLIVSLPIFLPEFPHGNLLAVGTVTGFLSAFSIFVWSIGDQISINPTALATAGNATFEYLRALLSFVRQGAFAGVALFGALFFAAFTTEFQYIDTTVTAQADKFLLHINTSAQIGFYAIYAISGPIRYFFLMNLQILSHFREIAARLDRQTTDVRAGVQRAAIEHQNI